MSGWSAKNATTLLAASVVAGFGLSAGRDGWSYFRKRSSSVLLFAALAGVAIGPFFGARELVRGHNRSLCGTLIKTLLGSVAMTAAGLLLGGCLAFAIGVLAGSQGALAATVMLMMAVALAGGLAGLVTGAFQRPGRKRGFRIAEENDAFLQRIGFRETGGTDVTHYDGEDNALRFLERHSDRLVFMPVGRRGKRGYISLDKEGRMTGYSGIDTRNTVPAAIVE